MSDKLNYWIKDAGERVISAAGEVASVIAALYVFAETTGLLELDWQTLATAGPLVVVATIVKTIAASRIGDKGTAAFDRDPARFVDAEFHQDDTHQEG